jgi:RNA polymerase sigma factor (sigma-70 family)
MAEEAVLYRFVPQHHEGVKPVANPSAPPGDIAVALLGLWDDDIHRAAAHGARLMGGDADDAEDLAQEARLRLMRATSVTPGAPIGYLRHVVKNSVLSGLRRERRAITTSSPRGQALDVRMETPSSGTDDRILVVAKWVEALPGRLRLIYDLLYEQGLTQRQTGGILGISQPRVAQLHRVLLERGRLELASVAA